MTTRATDAKRKRGAKLTYDDVVGGTRYQTTSSGVGFKLGAEGGGDRPELPPIEKADARFSLAEDTGESGSDLKKQAADVWEKHKSAILFGAAALVLIAIVRKR